MTEVEEAGIVFSYSFYDDSDERGPATGWDLVGWELLDANEFEKVTGTVATDENVRAYVHEHEDAMGEVALEQAKRDAERDYDPPDDEDASDVWGDIA